MDTKSVGLNLNHVQSTGAPESPVQDQSAKPEVSGQTAPNQQIETISNLEKNSRIGQMKFEGSLQQANLNMVLDAQPKEAPTSAKDVTNPANDGIVKNEDPLPQVIESAGITRLVDIQRSKLGDQDEELSGAQKSRQALNEQHRM